MKKSTTILAASCVVLFVDSNIDTHSEWTNAVVGIIRNFTLGKNLTASFGMLLMLSAGLYHLLGYRERRSRQTLSLEVDQLTKRYQDLTEKYKNALTATSDESIDSQDQRFLKKIIKTVEDNMSDSKFKVERMAQEVGMSRTNLHRKVKATTGFSPREFIRNIRLRRAADLLRANAESVSQIGYIVGFEDNSYFSKSFKKEFGVPPSEYVRSSNGT
jgi:AraC-like DNA-binding protein